MGWRNMKSHPKRSALMLTELEAKESCKLNYCTRIASPSSTVQEQVSKAAVIKNTKQTFLCWDPIIRYPQQFADVLAQAITSFRSLPRTAPKTLLRIFLSNAANRSQFFLLRNPISEEYIHEGCQNHCFGFESNNFCKLEKALLAAKTARVQSLYLLFVVIYNP